MVFRNHIIGNNGNYYCIDFDRMISEVFNIDCNEYMQDLPDKFFDLAIIDTEYGINVNHNMGRRKGDRPSNYKPVKWDNKPPNKYYFLLLMSKSKNQIIWGANHFIDNIPGKLSSPCWIVWDKLFSEDVSFSQVELAWTSFDSVSKKFILLPNSQKDRIHPTQKPIALYKWLLKNYAKSGDKIFDSHMGSQSSRIACYDMGFDFWGCELDKEYFDAGCKRFEQFKSQLKLF